MSLKRRGELKEYVMKILMHKDTRLEFIYQDNDRFLKTFTIENMNFTLDNLDVSLQSIASYLFRPGEAYKTHYVDALLIYSMKLDEYLLENIRNYKTNFLADILVGILIVIDYDVPKRYCTIL